jgi:hypothetical protein
MKMMTVAQQIQKQRAGMIARLMAVDPHGARSGWTVWDSFAELMAAFEWLAVQR